MSLTSEGLPIPPVVLARHDGWNAELAWSFASHTATWRLTRDSETRFLKVTREGWEPSLAAERARLEWAIGRLPVPSVLDGGADDGVEWLLLTGLPGRDATVHPLRHDPAKLVPILARGLRTLHETRVDDCPFDFTLDPALDLVRDASRADSSSPIRTFTMSIATSLRSGLWITSRPIDPRWKTSCSAMGITARQTS